MTSSFSSVKISTLSLLEKRLRIISLDLSNHGREKHSSVRKPSYCILAGKGYLLGIGFENRRTLYDFPHHSGSAAHYLAASKGNNGAVPQFSGGSMDLRKYDLDDW